MAYDQHGDGGTPGPVAGLDWDNAILQATLPDLDPAHMSSSAFRSTGARGAASAVRPRTRTSSTTRSRCPGARVDYDFSAQTPFIVSPNGSLTTYFDDADSLARKIALVHTYGLGRDRRLAARLRGPGVLVALQRLRRPSSRRRRSRGRGG